jgi:hypothetical protein
MCYPEHINVSSGSGDAASRAQTAITYLRLFIGRSRTKAETRGTARNRMTGADPIDSPKLLITHFKVLFCLVVVLSTVAGILWQHRPGHFKALLQLDKHWT